MLSRFAGKDSDRRCRLCQFRLEEGDRSTDFMHKSWNRYSESHWRCISPLYGSPNYEAVASANAFFFNPTTEELVRRAASLEEFFLSVLSEISSRRLPPEILGQIAESVFCEFVVAKTLAEVKPRDSPFSFDLFDRVWALRVDFQGHRYMRTVYNAVGASDEDEARVARGEELIYDPQQGQADTVFAVVDHFGVRQIYFGQQDTTLDEPAEPGVWWLILAAKRKPILAPTDGTKVRTLRLDTKTPQPCLLWPEPHLFPMHHWVAASHPRPLNRTHELAELVRPEMPVRMDTLELDQPGVFGYSFCVDGDFVRGNEHLMLIHTHIPGEDVGFYDAPIKSRRDQERNLWTFVPLEESEKMAEIWVRSGYSTQCFLILTTKSRLHRIGWWSASTLHQPWILLYKSQRGPRRILYEKFDDLTRGVFNIAFDPRPDDPPLAEEGATAPQDQSTHQEAALTPHSGGGDAFLSAASLDDVINVATYLDHESRVCGLLLTYRDGHKERLAHVRLHRPGPSYPVSGDGTEHLYFCLAEDAFILGFSVGNQAPMAVGAGGVEEVFEVPLRGRMEWAVGRYGRNRFAYGERISHRPRTGM